LVLSWRGAMAMIEYRRMISGVKLAAVGLLAVLFPMELMAVETPTSHGGGGGGGRGNRARSHG